MKLHRTTLSVASALTAVLLVGACDDSPTTAPDESFDPDERYAVLSASDEVALRADADSFEPGATVSLTLRNESGEAVGYNLCFHELERLEGGGWAPVTGAGQICTAVLYTLEDGRSVTYSVSLPSTLGEGVYRFRTSIHFVDRGESRDAVTGPFEVRG